jgi:hypothetical protein
MFECDVTLHRDVDVVQQFGQELFARYTGGDPAIYADMVAAQAPKRVAMQFVERRRATWDHGKLGGVY